MNVSTANNFAAADGIITTSVGDSNHAKPSPSTTFDDNDSLSQGIREYVSSKITEMLVEHQRNLVCQHPKTISAPFHFTINPDMSSLAKVPRSGTANVKARVPFVFDGPKNIGPFTINHPRIAGDFQITVIGIYSTFVIGAAFLGPQTLLLTLWRIGIVLAGYAFVRSRLGWGDDVHSDVILGPICHIGHEMQYFSGEATKSLGALMINALMEILRGVLKNDEVDQDGK